LEEVISWDKFVNSVEEAKNLVRPQKIDYLDLFATRYPQLRR
jgi:hypothetical protein